MKLLRPVAAVSGVQTAVGIAVNIINGCDEPLTITGTDGYPTLRVLQPGQTTTQYPSGSSGRYQAYWSASDIGRAKYGLFEYTVCGDRLCCNPSHVDLLTMPVTLTCAADGQSTGCTNNPSMTQIRAAMDSCPTKRSEFGSVSDSQTCYSAGYACAVHPGADNCGFDSNAPMQRAMRKFGGSDSSKNAYGCAGSFAQDSTGCAKVNRGVDSPTTGSPSTFYQAYEDGIPLFNEYSKWLHDLCGDNDYAFPYDDNGKHGGYMECNGDVTVHFCTAGQPGPPSPTPAPTPVPTPVPAPSPVPSPTPGSWGPCTGGACCNPYASVAQYCPDGEKCQDCGGGEACQCPGGPSPSPSPSWSPCSGGSCCNPHSSVAQYCPSGDKCQECGGGDACQCPAYYAAV